MNREKSLPHLPFMKTACLLSMLLLGMGLLGLSLPGSEDETISTVPTVKRAQCQPGLRRRISAPVELSAQWTPAAKCNVTGIPAAEKPVCGWQAALSAETALSMEELQALAVLAVREKGAVAFAELEASRRWTPAEKRPVAAIMMCAWSESDPVAAVTWLTQHPECLQNATLISGLAFNVLEADPVAALAWMDVVPEAEVRAAGIQSLWNEWAQSDAAAAQQWRRENPAHEAVLGEAGL